MARGTDQVPPLEMTKWFNANYHYLVPGELDPPVVGGFEGNHGQFFGDDVVSGRTIRVRFDWQNISPTSSRWSQAFSADDAKTWEDDWVMDFTRTG